ncbi:hypothetical protein ACOKM3_07360 [Streptomyces sp. BH106]|uniref:hypothetical protein n=1 Tax=Streptomyces sp. BH106 TaxID=3410409 RepID=UPI003CF961FA
MIISMPYGATRALLSIPMVLLRRDTAKDAELLVLQHENAGCDDNSAARPATSPRTGSGRLRCRR